MDQLFPIIRDAAAAVWPYIAADIRDRAISYVFNRLRAGNIRDYSDFFYHPTDAQEDIEDLLLHKVSEQLGNPVEEEEDRPVFGPERMPRTTRSKPYSRGKSRVRKVNVDQPKTSGAKTANVLKPIINEDVPANAELLRLTIIPADVEERDDHFKLQRQNKTDGYQEYGDILNFAFPHIDQQPGVINPDTVLRMNRIFDIDCDISPKPVRALYNTAVMSPDINGLGQIPQEVAQDMGYKVRYLTQGKVEKTVDDNDINDELVDEWRSPNTFLKVSTYDNDAKWQYNRFDRTNQKQYGCIFVINKRKQKVLGDWIQSQNNRHQPDKQREYIREGKFPPMTPWMFDKFCNEVRPLFAKHMEWVPTTKSLVPVMVYGHEPATGTPGKVEYVSQTPFAGITTNGEWRYREFHLHQDQAGLGPTDNYCQELLLGSLGKPIAAMVRTADIKVYYREENINASTLFFQENITFQNPANTRGSRHEYGPVDFDTLQQNVNAQREHGELLVDADFRGVISSNVGEFTYFADGEVNTLQDGENILQVKDSATWLK